MVCLSRPNGQRVQVLPTGQITDRRFGLGDSGGLVPVNAVLVTDHYFREADIAGPIQAGRQWSSSVDGDDVKLAAAATGNSKCQGTWRLRPSGGHPSGDPKVALALKDSVRPGDIRDPAPGKLFQRMQWQRDTLPTPFHRNVREQGFESEISIEAKDRLRAGRA